MKSRQIPKYALHRASGQAVVYINRKPVYLGTYGSEQSRGKYDEVTGQWLKEQSSGPLQPEPAPPLRCHAADGRAVVRIGGRDFYCGKHGTAESRELYARLIAAWMANGRRIEGIELYLHETVPDDLTITELLARFMRHAIDYYSESNEADCFKYPAKLLKQLFGTLPARQFSPKKLKLVRDEMVEKGWKRRSINKHVNRLRHIFKWAVSEELVPVDVYQRLTTLKALRQGAKGVLESSPVIDVPADRIQAVRPFVSRQVWAMIQLQFLTGARPGEITTLRPREIDRSGDPWVARLGKHKNAHRGHLRSIVFGPRAVETLKEFLEGRPEDAYLFSPAEAERERRIKQHAVRKSKVQPSQVRRSELAAARRPKRPVGEFYTVGSYRRAIARACALAFKMPEEFVARKDDTAAQRMERRAKRTEWHARNSWHPHQLRHTAATNIAQQFGLEDARAVLGQRHIATTLIYAHHDLQRAAAVIQKIG